MVTRKVANKITSFYEKIAVYRKATTDLANRTKFCCTAASVSVCNCLCGIIIILFLFQTRLTQKTGFANQQATYIKTV
jgi:hypothetical protein